jgi:alanyl-tRNA synthetase
MRVMADHIRAITCAIADGQLPSNNKAGYVIRRILRRAVRYGFTFLNSKSPSLKTWFLSWPNSLTAYSRNKTSAGFPRARNYREELSFLRTLETGIRRFEEYKGKNVDGEFAFELYDTYGFPLTLPN